MRKFFIAGSFRGIDRLGAIVPVRRSVSYGPKPKIPELSRTNQCTPTLRGGQEGARLLRGFVEAPGAAGDAEPRRPLLLTD